MTKQFNALVYSGGKKFAGEKKFTVSAVDAEDAFKQACLAAYGEEKSTRHASTVVRSRALSVDNLHVQWDHYGFNGIAVEEFQEGRIAFTPATKDEIAAYKAANI